MDPGLAARELGFRLAEEFSAGLAATVRWHALDRSA